MNRRGEHTYAKLLDAATRLFGERGFDGVSTREIATASGTTLPSIAHHFGSKQGLYDAVHAAMADGLGSQLAPAIRNAAIVLADARMTRDQAVAALQSLLGAHARALLSGRADLVALVVHEQLRPSAKRLARDRLFETKLLEPVLRIIGFLRNLPPESEAVKLQALMLAGRVLTFRVLRRSSLQLLYWRSFDHNEIEHVIAALQDEIEALFTTAPRPAPQHLRSRT